MRANSEGRDNGRKDLQKGFKFGQRRRRKGLRSRKGKERSGKGK